MKTLLKICVVTLLCFFNTARAELTMPSIFSDHMVLQRGESTPVWGKANPGENVNIEFGDQTVECVAGPKGKWAVTLKGLTANASGRFLQVNTEGEKLAFSDIVVGDVWLASGQSNMAMTVAKSEGADQATKAAADENLRIIVVRPAGVSPLAPLDEHKGIWEVAAPEMVGKVSAVGYYFIRRLRQEMKDDEVPLGLIHSAWGGTLAEHWTNREALLSRNETRPLWESYQQKVDDFDPATATPPEEVKRLMDEWRKKNREARAKKERIPKAPSIIGDPANRRYVPCNLFNTMISPFIPYGIKGAVWYQGEGNRARAEQYETLLPVMIADWRARWDQPNLPFCIVQLANIKNPAEEPVESDWAEQQWAQFVVARDVENAGLVVINDGQDTTLHPREKRKVGERAAGWALSQIYGQKDLEYSSPLYDRHEVKDGEVQVFFRHAKGLKSADGKKLGRFQIAGKDRQWAWADARIVEKGEGEPFVAVSSASVPAPVAVRYAWCGNPVGANLTNDSGLPASLFCTDDWPGLSHGKLLPE